MRGLVALSRNSNYTALAHADYSAHLRSIPAAASECAAQFALEPQQLAELGLTDAKRAAELQAEQPEAFVRVARAQLALEDYGAAESAALHALSLDADSDGAQVSAHRDSWLRRAPALQRRLPECDYMLSHAPGGHSDTSTC